MDRDVAASGPGTVPALFAGLCDDAALFPPGNAAVRDAVPAHRAYRTAWFAPLVGPFLAGADKVGEVGAAAAGPLEIVLVVRGGPQALAGALADAGRWPELRLVGVELGPDAEGTPAEAAARCCAALERELPDAVAGVVELRRGHGGGAALEAALDTVAASPYRAKYRTGGLEPGAFPGVLELAAFVTGCALRRLPFKCTAGLHHAVRRTDPATGFAHHGFLNILAATRAAASGEGLTTTAGLLASHRGEQLAEAVADLTPEQVAGTRALFTAYGTCSIAEPLDDLTALGLMEAPPA